MRMTRPLWTPPLFGWQYPIRWHADFATVEELPVGADIWRLRDGSSWFAAFRLVQHLHDPAHLRTVEVRIREKHPRLDVVVRRLEAHLRSLRRGFDAFDD